MLPEGCIHAAKYLLLLGLIPRNTTDQAKDICDGLQKMLWGKGARLAGKLGEWSSEPKPSIPLPAEHRI